MVKLFVQTGLTNINLITSLQGLHAPSPVNQSPNDQIWRDEELARAMQVSRECIDACHVVTCLCVASCVCSPPTPGACLRPIHHVAPMDV